jgi:hypothetical protein
VFERAIDGVEELADCGHEDLQLGFATCLSIVTESTQVDSDPTQCGTALLIALPGELNLPVFPVRARTAIKQTDVACRWREMGTVLGTDDWSQPSQEFDLRTYIWVISLI